MPAYDHFYTTSASERDNAVANLGYQDEGTACYTFDSQRAGTTPLYRLFKDTHFYTLSADERDSAIAAGWQFEETAGYVYGAPTGTVPLYRLVKEGHFDTTDLAERDNAITIDGFHSEASPATSSTPQKRAPYRYTDCLASASWQGRSVIQQGLAVSSAAMLWP